MTRRELSAWVERLAATAARMRAKHGQCSPTALLVVQGVPIPIDIILESENDRQVLRGLFEVAARGGAEACAFVAEAWAYGGSLKKVEMGLEHASKERSLADLPGRTESLFVHAVSPNATAYLAFDITGEGTLRQRPMAASSSPVLSRFLSDLPWPRTQPGSKRPARRR